jgi:hypothetical protein
LSLGEKFGFRVFPADLGFPFPFHTNEIRGLSFVFS